MAGGPDVVECVLVAKRDSAIPPDTRSGMDGSIPLILPDRGVDGSGSGYWGSSSG